MEKEKVKRLQEKGFSEFVVHLISVSGATPETLLEVKSILSKEDFSPQALAFLVIHYVDAYTRDDNWVEPVHLIKENDLDRRVQENKKYGELDRVIIAERAPNEQLFKGRTASKTMGILGHEIERLFVKLIAERTGKKIEPLKLPEVIDEEIRKRIAAFDSKDYLR